MVTKKEFNLQHDTDTKVCRKCCKLCQQIIYSSLYNVIYETAAQGVIISEAQLSQRDHAMEYQLKSSAQLFEKSHLKRLTIGK